MKRRELRLLELLIQLNLYAPAAMVGYFDEVAEATKTAGVDPAALAEIALRYSMEVIGPVPEGYV